MTQNLLIPNLVNGVQSGLLAQATQDDVALLWLTDQSKTNAVVAQLSANAQTVGVQQIPPPPTQLPAGSTGRLMDPHYKNPYTQQIGILRESKAMRY